MLKSLIAIAFVLFVGIAEAQAPAVQLQVGKTYFMLDGTLHTIVSMSDTKPRVFRSNPASAIGWYSAGTPSNGLVDRDGSKSLYGPLPPALIERLRQAPTAPGTPQTLKQRAAQLAADAAALAQSIP